MKKILTITLLAFIVININAQQKQKVAIIPISRGYSITEPQKDMVVGALENAFINSKNYSPLDRNNLDKIWEEIEINRTDVFNQKDIETIEWRGANIICFATISKSDVYSNEFAITFALKGVKGLDIFRSETEVKNVSGNQELFRVCENLAKKIANDVYPEEAIFDAGGGTDTITCYVEPFQIIPSKKSWYSTQKKDGNVIIKCDPILNIDQREDTLRLQLIKENRVVGVAITQKGADSFVDKTQLNFQDIGGEEKINILVGNEFDVLSYPGWASVIKSPNGDYITVKCDNNRSGKRNSKLELQFQGIKQSVKQTITIFQEERPIVDPKDKTIFLPASSGKYVIKLNTLNSEAIYHSEEKDNSKLCKNVKIKEGILTIDYDKNNTMYQKSMEIEVRAGNREDRIKITQLSKGGGTGDGSTIWRLKNPHKTFGLSVGYTQQGYNLCTDKNEEISTWKQPEVISGVQAGLKFNTFFAPNTFGLGIDWGLYYEYVSANKTAMNPHDREYSYNLEKHTAYIPVHLIYKVDFSRNFGIFIFGGVGLDCGVLENIKATYTGETEPFYQSPKGIDIASMMSRFNISSEYGGGVQFFGMMISATLSEKVFNPEEKFTNEQKKGMMVNLSFMF